MIDRTKISVIGGNGGNGCVAFRREKYVPRGGPSGGDGGRGGSVYALGNKNINTLLDLRFRKTFRAGNGLHGSGKDKHGKNGADRVVEMPLGTQIMDENGRILCDIREHGQKELLARGGRGGFGNAHFKSPTRQAPHFALPGNKGETRTIRLELKLIADAGLVGEPNAGKSTLLSRVSNARPKIADYPFTTLEPNLGLIRAGDSFSFTMADIPGLIEGAHRGRGLGHDFLRHIERTRLLVFVIDRSSGKDPKKTYSKLCEELRQFNPALLKKPSIVALNKSDISNNNKGLRSTKKRPVISISALTGKGLKHLVYLIKEMLRNDG
jgi:GTP-binding protein